MARFFVKDEQVKGVQVFIVGSDVRHISKVLRMQPGDCLTLIDEAGTEYEARITQIAPERITCEIVTETSVNREPPLEVILCQGLPKGDKLELIIQKGVELGVTRIIPVSCTRSVVQLTEEKAAKRRERWQRVALEAAKQCRRNKVPEVSPLTGFDEALQLIPDGVLAVIPWEDAVGTGLKKVLRSYNNRGQVWIFIGPEGGFTEAEIEKARGKGVVPVTLGRRILRTETAGIAAITMVLYQLGDLGGMA